MIILDGPTYICWQQKTKSQVFGAYKDFKAWEKLHSGIPAFKMLCPDRGGEYLGKEFNQYLSLQGIEHRLAVHDTPQYNRVSEHIN